MPRHGVRLSVRLSVCPSYRPLLQRAAGLLLGARPFCAVHSCTQRTLRTHKRATSVAISRICALHAMRPPHNGSIAAVSAALADCVSSPGIPLISAASRRGWYSGRRCGWAGPGGLTRHGGGVCATATSCLISYVKV